MKLKIKRRALKHGSVSIALTLLVVAAVVISNAAVYALFAGFGWYVDMSASPVYEIDNECREYISDEIFSLMDEVNKKNGTADKIIITFCDEEKNLDDQLAQEYVMNSIYQMRDLFPERIEIDFLNVWENPKLAKEYGVTDASDIVFGFGERHITLAISQFYVTTGGDIENPSAYIGGRRIASAMLRVVSETTPMCYFTLNHGEGLESSEFMYLLADAGLSYSFIDLAASDIPEDCELLITLDPTSDLLEPSKLSEISESAKLDQYMQNGGKYMVFLSANSLISNKLSNFERFLSEWGVEYMSATDSEGAESCCVIRDVSNSVSIDGYTFFSEHATSAAANEIFGASKKANVFGSSAAITVSDGFKAQSDSSYINGDRVWSPILTTTSSAEAWAGSLLVDKANDTPFTLMSLTEQKCENGKTAALMVCPSVEFCEEAQLQSTVYGNAETLLCILSRMGYKGAPTTLTARALQTPPIQSLTTKNAAIISAAMALVPTVVISLVGVFVLVRRRYS